MKTIQVSDEIYDFLINLSKEIKTQDNRCTAPPYFYQVQEDSEVCAPEGCGDEVWVLDGEVHLRTEDEIKEAIFEYNDWDLDDKNDQKAYNDLSKYDREDILEVNYRKYYVDIVHKYSNCFFTFKAYEEHLRKNGHNLNNPKSYLFHAVRNTEMEMLYKFLSELTSEAMITKGAPFEWSGSSGHPDPIGPMGREGDPNQVPPAFMINQNY